MSYFSFIYGLIIRFSMQTIFFSFDTAYFSSFRKRTIIFNENVQLRMISFKSSFNNTCLARKREIAVHLHSERYYHDIQVFLTPTYDSYYRL